MQQTTRLVSLTDNELVDLANATKRWLNDMFASEEGVNIENELQDRLYDLWEKLVGELHAIGMEPEEIHDRCPTPEGL